MTGTEKATKHWQSVIGRAESIIGGMEQDENAANADKPFSGDVSDLRALLMAATEMFTVATCSQLVGEVITGQAVKGGDDDEKEAEIEHLRARLAAYERAARVFVAEYATPAEVHEARRIALAALKGGDDDE